MCKLVAVEAAIPTIMKFIDSHKIIDVENILHQTIFGWT